MTEDSNRPPRPPERAAGGDYASTVSDVLTSVKERQAAAEEAARKQRPKGSRPGLLIAAMLALIGVGALDYYLLTRPAEGLPAAEQEVDLRYNVAALVDEVEAFRDEEGRLPTAAELAAELEGDDLTYRVEDEGYVVTAFAEGVEVVYRSWEDDMASWLAERRYEGMREGGGQ